MHVKALVRLALSNCVEGNSYWRYERQAAGWALGYEQLTGRIPLCALGSRRFAMEVEFLAARILEQLEAHSFNMKLPGIGVPSDIHLTPGWCWHWLRPVHQERDALDDLPWLCERSHRKALCPHAFSPCHVSGQPLWASLEETSY